MKKTIIISTLISSTLIMGGAFVTTTLTSCSNNSYDPNKMDLPDFNITPPPDHLSPTAMQPLLLHLPITLFHQEITLVVLVILLLIMFPIIAYPLMVTHSH